VDREARMDETLGSPTTKKGVCFAVYAAPTKKNPMPEDWHRIRDFYQFEFNSAGRTQRRSTVLQLRPALQDCCANACRINPGLGQQVFAAGVVLVAVG